MNYLRQPHMGKRLGRASPLGALLAISLLLFTSCASAERGLERAVDDAKRQANDLISEQMGAGGAPEGSKGEGNVHTVTRIVDGDTIEVSPDAAAGNEDVRFLAVDTPETYGGTEPLGPEAKAFTTAPQLEGEKVRLTYDQDRVDPYDRALAFVSVVGEEQSIQGQLLSRGLAQTTFFSPNYLYRDRMEAIQADARQRDVGIWGLPVSERCELAGRGNGIGEGSAEYG